MPAWQRPAPACVRPLSSACLSGLWIMASPPNCGVSPPPPAQAAFILHDGPEVACLVIPRSAAALDSEIDEVMRVRQLRSDNMVAACTHQAHHALWLQLLRT